jgi:hypothetical protein
MKCWSPFYLKLLAGEMARLIEMRFFNGTNWDGLTEMEKYRKSIILHGANTKRYETRIALEQLIQLSPVVGVWLDSSISLIAVGKRGGGFGKFYPSGFTLYLVEEEIQASRNRLMWVLARRVAFARAMRRRKFTPPTKLSAAYVIALKFERKLVLAAAVDQDYLELLDTKITKWTAFSCD